MLNKNELVDILEEAQAMHDKAQDYFEYYANENNDQEMAQIYWTRSQEYSGKCEGLLTAYMIITKHWIPEYNIRAELSRINQH